MAIDGADAPMPAYREDTPALVGITSSPEEASRPPPITIDGAWEPWYAWHPVRLYMSGRLAWMRRIHRRAIHRCGMAMWDYTDQPEMQGDPPVE